MLTLRAFGHLFAMRAPAAFAEVDDLTPRDFAVVAFGKMRVRAITESETDDPNMLR
jgi:hypothetical protein